jgi:hypothetical protein
MIRVIGNSFSAKSYVTRHDLRVDARTIPKSAGDHASLLVTARKTDRAGSLFLCNEDARALFAGWIASPISKERSMPLAGFSVAEQFLLGTKPILFR